jgi:DNA helicase II / ATP-dependent DNA helicase PcrA
VRWQDFAILYRTNAQSRIFEEMLRKKNIPYKVYGGLSFYERKEIRDILAYFRMIVNPADEEAFSRSINFPKRGIGDTSVARTVTSWQRLITPRSGRWQNILTITADSSTREPAAA